KKSGLSYDGICPHSASGSLHSSPHSEISNEAKKKVLSGKVFKLGEREILFDFNFHRWFCARGNFFKDKLSFRNEIVLLILTGEFLYKSINLELELVVTQSC